MSRVARAWLAAVLACAAVVGIGGAAHAVWSGAGTGLGTAGAGSATQLEIRSEVSSAGLVPGGSADVLVTARNLTDADLRLGTLSLDTARGGIVVRDAPGCPSTAFAFAATRVDVDARASSETPVTLRGALSLAIDAPNACQGVTVRIFLQAAS